MTAFNNFSGDSLRAVPVVDWQGPRPSRCLHAPQEEEELYSWAPNRQLCVGSLPSDVELHRQIAVPTYSGRFTARPGQKGRLQTHQAPQRYGFHVYHSSLKPLITISHYQSL